MTAAKSIFFAVSVWKLVSLVSSLRYPKKERRVSMHKSTNAQTLEMSRLIWNFSEFFSYFFKVLPVNARGLRKISVRANVPAY